MDLIFWIVVGVFLLIGVPAAVAAFIGCHLVGRIDSERG